jgi:hypothetical protein
MKMHNVVARVAGCMMVATVSATATAQARPTAGTPDSATRKAAAAKSRGAPRVTLVENSVRPTKFVGKCPATLHWTAHLTVRNPPVKVQYQWLRSDSAKGPLKEILIRGTEAIIGGESWQLGGDKEHIIVWERLAVLEPNVLHSRAVAVNVTCR